MDIYSIRLPEDLIKLINQNATAKGLSTSHYVRQMLERSLISESYPQLTFQIESLYDAVKFIGVASLQSLFLNYKTLTQSLPISEDEKHCWLKETLEKAQEEINKNLGEPD